MLDLAELPDWAASLFFSVALAARTILGRVRGTVHIQVLDERSGLRRRSQPQLLGSGQAVPGRFRPPRDPRLSDSGDRAPDGPDRRLRVRTANAGRPDQNIQSS